MSDELGYISKEKLFIALVSSDAFSNLPEMLEVLGDEKFLAFVEIFGGQTLTIPRMQDIATAVRDVMIHERFTNEGVQTSVLADQHGITAGQIRRIVARVTRANNFGAQKKVSDDV